MNPTQTPAASPIPRRRFWRPLRMDLYILSETVSPFLGGIVFFTFVFLMAQALRWAEMVIVHGVALPMLGKMASYVILSFMPFIIPPALLIGVLIGFGRLSSESELIAMKASGFSVARLAVPVFLFASLLAMVEYELNMNWAPQGERAMYRTMVRLGNTRVAASLREGTFVSGFFDLLIYAEKVDPQSNRLRHVFVYDEREPTTPLVVVAKSGDIVPIQTKTELGVANMLVLHDGTIHRNDASNNTVHKIQFKDYKLFLRLEEGEDNAPIKPRMLDEATLSRRLALRHQDNDHGAIQLEYWRRYALALTPLVFALLGIGYGCFSFRAVRAGAGLIAFLVVLLFWVLLTLATSIAQKGLLPPWAAMQLPNLILFIAGSLRFRAAMR